MESRETIGKRLKKALAIRSMKASELAKSTGLSKSVISEYINDKYAPRADNIYVLCKVLDINEAWLMGFTDNMERISDEQRQKNPIYSAATKEQKTNMQRRTLDDVESWFDKDTQEILLKFLHCNTVGKKIALDRLTELEILYPNKENGSL
mgnify:CR=1 FL=1